MSAVVMRLAGGLGNQLFQYAAGLALAESRRARLLLDLSLYRRDKLRTYALDAFAVEPSFVPRPWASLMGTFDRRLVGRAMKTLMPVVGWHYVLDRGQGCDATVFPPGGSLVLEGYWQSENYFAGVADRVRAAFRFRDPPDAANAACLDRIAAGPAVAAHVRRGDYASAPEITATYGLCGPDYYRAAADYLQQTVPNARYFVFSDDPDWAEQHLRWPGPSEVVRHNVGKRDADDLRLMAACDHFVIANSSFSWWGAWLANKPDKVVVAPKRWFAGAGHAEADRVPPEWVRL
jgi:Glycosyl transferase family 11